MILKFFEEERCIIYTIIGDKSALKIKLFYVKILYHISEEAKTNILREVVWILIMLINKKH